MNSKISKAIGKRINALLAKKFKRQKDLATALGVNDNTISYFVSGKRMPNTEQIIKISDFFGVSADYLLGLSDTPTTDKDIQFICEYTGLSEKSVEKLHTKLANSIMKKSIDGEKVFVDGEKVFEIVAKIFGKEMSEVKNDYTNGDENTRSTIENYAAVYLREIEDNKTYLKYLNELIEEDFTITDIITNLNNYVSRCSWSENDDNGGLKIINRNMEYFDILSIALCLKDFADKLRGENNGNNP